MFSARFATVGRRSYLPGQDSATGNAGKGAERPPSWLAMAHGLLAGSGLTLLLYAGLTAGIPSLAWIGIVLLATAALGGVYLNLAFHARLLAIPKTIVIVHALLAATGFVLIAWTAFA